MERDVLEKFKRFLTERCDSEEVHKIIQWINSPEAKAFLEERFDSFRTPKNFQFESEEVFSEILDRIHSKELGRKVYQSLEEEAAKEVSMKPANGVNRISRSIWLAAASVSIILITFFGGYYTNEISIPAREGLVTKSTESGQKLTFHLSDGTMVKLNSNSSIRFPTKNPENKREVWLDGEAFFEVAENPEKPFIVHSNQISTTALGTSFTVRAFESGPDEVFLLTGKVNVRLNEDPSKNQLLEPGQSVVFDSDQSQFNVDPFNPGFETAWKDGVLAFEKSPYSEVIEKLESWYGVRIEAIGTVPGNLYSSSKFQNDYLQEVMKSLAYSWEFEYEIDEQENVVRIEFMKK